MAEIELKEVFSNLKIIREQEGQKTIYKFSGPFQEMNDVRGTKNKNGRIYNKKLWEKALNDKSVLERLESRRMLGELDHPCFTNREFRVLTSEGWKEFVDIKIGDKVWSRVKGRAVLSNVDAIVNESYEGLAYHVYGRSMDSTFTPAHKFVTVKRPDRVSADTIEHFVTIAEISDDPGRFAHSAVPKTAVFPMKEKATITLPGVDNFRCRNDVSKPLVLDAKLFAAFMGIYLAEGYIAHNNYDVHISQSNQWSKDFIYSEILSKFPAALQWRETDSGYALSDKRLHTYCKVLGNSYVRYVPEEIKNLGTDALRELLFWFCIGDGRMVSVDASIRNSGKTVKEQMHEEFRAGHVTYSRQDLFSVSERLVRDLHECLVKCGEAGSISCIETENDYEFAGHTIKAANKVPLWQLHISHSKNIWLDPRFLKIDKEYYKGNIYCLTTTHGSFYVEQNGHAFWTGNSDDGQIRRTSHIITDIKPNWDEGVVYGTLELLNHNQGDAALIRALVEQGVQLCVSSRGFGEFLKDGCTIDPETYKLVTWDIVLDPSVPIATLQKVAESVNRDLPDGQKVRQGFKETVSDKIDDKQGSKQTIQEDFMEDKVMSLLEKNGELLAKAAKFEANLTNMQELLNTKNERISSLENANKTLTEKVAKFDEQATAVKTLTEKVATLEGTLKQYEEVEDRAIKVIESLKSKLEHADTLSEKAADTIEELMEKVRSRKYESDDADKADKDVDVKGTLRNWEPDPNKGDELEQLKGLVKTMEKKREEGKKRKDEEDDDKDMTDKEKEEKRRKEERRKREEEEKDMTPEEKEEKRRKEEKKRKDEEGEEGETDREKELKAELEKIKNERKRKEEKKRKEEEGEEGHDEPDGDEVEEPTPEEKRESRKFMLGNLTEALKRDYAPKKV